MGLKDIAVAKSAAMIQGADFAYCTAQAGVAILEQVKEKPGLGF